MGQRESAARSGGRPARAGRRVAALASTGVLLAMSLAAGCSAAPPPGIDGDLNDDWPGLSTPTPFRPAVGDCHEAPATTVPLDDYRPVGCAELHVSETFHVGTSTDADAEIPPATGSAAAREAFRECSQQAAAFLGGPWRAARLGLNVVWPTRAGWSGGARWFRCDLTQSDLDGQSGTSRNGTLAGVLKTASPLRLGCFNPEVDGETVTTMTAVPCDKPHRAEFAGLWQAPEVSYAKLEEDTAGSAAGCRAAIAGYAGLPNDDDMQYRTGWISYNPTRTEWISGERRVRCFMYFAKRTFTRSLKNAGPSTLPAS